LLLEISENTLYIYDVLQAFGLILFFIGSEREKTEKIH